MRMIRGTPCYRGCAAADWDEQAISVMPPEAWLESVVSEMGIFQQQTQARFFKKEETQRKILDEKERTAKIAALLNS